MLKRIILSTLALIIIFSGITFYGELIFATESMAAEELHQDTLSFLEYLQTADYAKAVEQFDEKVKATLSEKDFEEL